jgi:Fe-S-cluster containining protein
MLTRRNKRDRRAPRDAEGLEFEGRRAQRLQTAEILNQGRTPLQVIEVAKTAANLADQAIRTAMARVPPQPPIACQEGCAWCCHKLVGTTIPEVIRIVEYLRDKLSTDELQATQERIIQTDEQRRSLKEDRWKAARLPCSLLVNNRCSVYPVRPVTCRGYNSSDPKACERTVKVRELVEVPTYSPQHRVAAFVLDGMRAGLAESGLPNEHLELTAALRIAFTTLNALERWLAGEPLFALAKLPG